MLSGAPRLGKTPAAEKNSEELLAGLPCIVGISSCTCPSESKFGFEGPVTRIPSRSLRGIGFEMQLASPSTCLAVGPLGRTQEQYRAGVSGLSFRFYPPSKLAISLLIGAKT